MEKGRPNFKFYLDKINSKIIETDESQATQRISNNSNTSRSLINFEGLTKNNESDYDSIIHSIMFKFSDKTFISYDLKTVVKAYPSITSQIDNKKELLQEITIIIPEWISSQNLKEYFHYISDDVDDFTMSVRKLLFIAEFFDNKEIIEKIVKNDIIPNINREDCLIFLEDSYKKLNSKPQDNEIWFDLFYTSLNAFVINFQYFLENEFEKIILINKDILEETIEMYFKLLHNGNTSSLKNENYIRIINIMHKIRGTQNIHDLIVNEYSRISSQETTDEFLSLKPTFKIKFQKKIKHFYKEFDEIKIQNQEITFISYHKKKEDMLNISFKMLFPQINEFNLKILTMLSVVYIKNDIDNMQVNVKSISLYKQFNNIFSSSKLSNYEENMKKKNNTNINIHIYIKVCYLHSAILNFYLKNFCLFYDNIEINKLSKSTIYSIFQNKYLKATGDQIVLALINWLKYEKNYFYDVINILEIISWNSVSLGCMLEFLMKFGKLFETCNIKNIFSNVIETKLINCIKNNQNGIKTIIKDSNQRNIETNSLIDIIIDVSKKLNIFSFKKQDLISNEFKEFSDEKKKSSLVDDKKTSSINEKTRDDIIKYESEGSIERDKNTINENVSVQGNNEIFNNFLKINKNNDESDDIYDDINTLQSNEINLILSNHDSHFSTLKLNKDLDKYTNKANSVNLKTESNEMQTLLAENKTTIRKNFVKIIRENKNDVLEIQKDKEKLYGIIAEKTKIELKVKENLKNDKKTKNIKDKGNSVIKQISFPKEIKKSITRNEKNIVSHNTQSLIDTEAIRDEIYNKVYQSKMKSSSSSKLKNSEIKNNANKNMSKFKQSPSALSQEKILKFKAKSKNNSIKKKLLLGNM